jgi:tetratricopeptide (TPR) repeat protein
MFKHLFVTVLMGAAMLFASTNSEAQSTVLDLPRDSQHARLMQRIGLTDITINYHRPLVNGRQVWGKLVPYGEVWRAGANENTTIEFTDPVTVEGKPLAAGIYGLHMLPGENEWTVIFSRMAASWGSFTYDQKEDALRVAVKPQPSELHEALTYDFDDVKPNAATVTLRWEKLAVPFKLEVDTPHLVEQSLEKQLRGLAQYTWEGWDDAATYLADHKGNQERALAYEDRSIRVEDRFENEITKARILDTLNRKQEAAVAKDKAFALANAIQLHSYGRQLQTQGKHEEALEMFRVNVKKYPNHWLAHNDASRLAVAQGNFDTAVKEMKLALANAPDQAKPQVEALIKRLEAKQDINR